MGEMYVRHLDIAKSVYNREGVPGILRSVTAYGLVRWHRTTDRAIRSNGILVPPHPRIGNLVLAKIIRGRYESDECRLIQEYVPANCNLVDLGAGIGFTSAFANRHVDDIRTHIAVEANPDISPVLQRTKELNECEFDIVPAAYTTADSSVMFARGLSLTRSSIYRSEPNSETIPSVTLRELVGEFDLSEFVLVADIEGAEQDLLNDELHLLTEHCPVVIVEFHRSVLGENLTPWLDLLDDDYTLVAEHDPVFAFVRNS